MSKVVLVTGGSSGIGRSIGEYLLEKGYSVYGTSRNPQNYPDSKLILLELDVTDNHSIKNAIKQVIDKAGRLDVLINNAGVGITGPIEEIPESEIVKIFETNFYGPLNLIKEVLPQMRKQKSGQIINITSIAGYMGLPYRGVYSASKAALQIITEAISMEIKDFNIKISNLAPGDFATNIAAGRYHSPISEKSPYHPKYGNVLNAIDAHVDKANNPVAVAEAVFKILSDPSPKLHYKVGDFMQKFSIVLKKLLPSRAYEKILLKHYKL